MDNMAIRSWVFGSIFLKMIKIMLYDQEQLAAFVTTNKN